MPDSYKKKTNKRFENKKTFEKQKVMHRLKVSIIH